MTESPLRLVDTTLFFSPTSGGVRRYLLAKHAWLRDRTDVLHTLVVPGERDGFRPGGQCEIASPRLPAAGGYRLPLRLRAWRRCLEDLRPDAIEFGDPYTSARAARSAARSCGAALVGFCHSDLPRLLGSLTGRMGATLGAALVRSAYRDADLVLAPSRSVAATLDACGIGRLAVQPLGVDTAVFSPAAARRDLKQRLALPPDARVLVFAGRSGPEKDIPLLLRTVERLGSPYWLVLVGGHDKAASAPRTRVIPWVREARELAGWLGACDVFVHAGRQETFGLVALEALACGTPVACVGSGALPEIVTPEVGAIAARPDEQGLAEAVASLFERPRAALAAAARRHVLAHYTWDAVFTTLLGRYVQLLGRRPASPPDPVPALA